MNPENQRSWTSMVHNWDIHMMPPPIQMGPVSNPTIGRSTLTAYLTPEMTDGPEEGYHNKLDDPHYDPEGYGNSPYLEGGDLEDNGLQSGYSDGSNGDVQQPNNPTILDSSLDPEYDDQDHTLMDFKNMGSDYDLDEFGQPWEEEYESFIEDIEDKPSYPSDDASQRSEDLGILPDEEEYAEYDDGASQRSDDWDISPDEELEQGFESPDEDNELYEDEDHQYEYGDDEGPYDHLALIPQHFPRALWSLQLPKSLHLNEFTKYGHAGKPSIHYLFDTPLLHIISFHIPLLITIAAFELFIQSTILQFVQGLQLSRHFVSSLEGTDIIVNY
ncbi:hypothetical protein PQX77_021887 [Marasmius sp. AFHP31]|nr:hypothetical protein PQX77_021887 [Marasmius sp. AFHP31]